MTHLCYFQVLRLHHLERHLSEDRIRFFLVPLHDFLEAVGSRTFVENIEAKLTSRAIGRKIAKAGGQSSLQEPRISYRVVSGLEKGVMSSEQSIVWNDNVV